MFPIANIVGQVPMQGYVTPQEASLIFSGPQFLVALVSGIVMAIAFQLLLTNLSIAVGISSLGGDFSDDDNSDTVGGTISKVEAKVGIWALITATIALFIACFLAVKLSLIESTVLGAIIGVVIWSTYFSVIVWLGSSAAGALIGSLINTASSGIQGIMGTATGVLGANAAKNQMVSTAEDITAAVRRELTSGFDGDSIKNTVENSLKTVNLPKLNFNEIRTQFDQVLQDGNLQSLGNSNLLKSVNRDTFVNLISNRTDFSQEDINQVADQLEGAWNQAVNGQNPTQQVIDLIAKATPDQLNSEELGSQLQKQLAGVLAGGGSGLLMQQAVKYGLGAAVPAMMSKLNLSDLDVEKIKPQLQKLKHKLPEIDIEEITQQLQNLRKQATQKISQASTNPIKADVQEYILNSFPWHFNRLTLKDEFKEVIYDTSADPTKVKQQLEEIDREYLNNLLKQRQELSEVRVKEIVQQMEEIRSEVLQTLGEAAEKETSKNLRSQIEQYLNSTSKEELNPSAIKQDFSKLLEDSQANFDELKNRLQQFNRDDLVKVLSQRQDISQEEADNIVGQLENTRDNVLNRAQELQQQATNKANELQEKVENYLLNTNKEELNPEEIKRDFKALIDEPELGAKLLRQRLAQFDRDTLVKLLSQRQDLSEEEVNQKIDQLFSVRDNVLQAPQKVAEKTKQQYEQTVEKLSEYLRNTDQEELNPEGIKRDLQKLLDEPKQGASALRDRLSQIDRETLVKLLSQRQDLSEEQVNQVIDNLQDTITDIVKAPRRLAKRTSERVANFQADIEEYLRSTDKQELNPEGIKRDLQLLLQDPRSGIENLGSRISQFDRDTLVSVLSQREDISEEEANQIADQIESTRDSIVQQYQQVQQKVQSAVDETLDKIRNYLNSLERPELNYEGIKQDFAKLFDDPQMGFEALRDRLSEFDRDSLIAVLSSREDVSQKDAERIVSQIEAARDSVLQRGERIQKETQKRLKAIKQQAKKQAIDAKAAAASAAWWLFGAALTSLVGSAIAGVLAVRSIY
ncbi:MFS transporter [Plectonema cf. radiosum LEGE 06105]|uniref:MFS transporter n=1 Tax=Plectonema cf. radiosum LEGE 06105 TaxID=945769 RepID=A0A8J7F3N7_9CYAN|nr:MFS transporter [Plectonema radiosum]MBE9214442.1 MFS transporter [Plectonema cf. radiosum LEGE 06105]